MVLLHALLCAERGDQGTLTPPFSDILTSIRYWTVTEITKNVL